MRKIVLLTLSAVGLSSGLFAQLLTNDGAMLVIEDGATLKVEGGVSNIGTGEIRNGGTLEIQGDFTNLATWTNVGDNDLVFSGAGASNVRSGTAVFDNVKINKTAGQNVNLVVTDMTVGGVLSFISDDNKINIGANDLVIQDAGSIVGADDDDYVMTGDVGYLRKEGLGASPESFVFPVGYDEGTYNPATIAGNVGHTSDVFSVRVRENLFLDGLAEMDQATEEAVDAMWDITEGMAGGSDVDLTLQWAVSDQLPDFPTEVGISRYDVGDMNWDLLESQVSDPGVGDPRTSTRDNVTEFSAFAVGGKPVGHQLGLNLTAILSGAYDAGAGLMWDNLRSGSLIPVGEPYKLAPFNYVHTGFGGDESVNVSVFTPTGSDAIVDWVLLELRDETTPATKLASRTALIQRDGDIVDIDGVSPVYMAGLPDGDYYIAVKHRNHLGIMTAMPQSLSLSPLPYDFTTGLSQTYDPPIPVTVQYPMSDLGGGVYGMWPGNTNNNLNTRYSGTDNDKTPIQNAVLSAPSNLIPQIITFNYTNQYAIEDVNMNGAIRYSGGGIGVLSNDKVIIQNAVLSYPSNLIPGVITFPIPSTVPN